MMRKESAGMRDSPLRVATHSRHITLAVPHHTTSTVQYLDGQEKVSSQGLGDATTWPATRHVVNEGRRRVHREVLAPWQRKLQFAASSTRRTNMERHG